MRGYVCAAEVGFWVALFPKRLYHIFKRTWQLHIAFSDITPKDLLMHMQKQVRTQQVPEK